MSIEDEFWDRTAESIDELQESKTSTVALLQ